MADRPRVLVVGGTGALGGRVVRELVARGNPVRALVRDGGDTSRLTALGVELTSGDLTDPTSLPPALDGVDAVVTTAEGYLRRRRQDSLAAVDDRGNRNLVEAARSRGSRFAFTARWTTLAPICRVEQPSRSLQRQRWPRLAARVGARNQSDWA